MSWFEADDPATAYARALVASHGIDADVPDSEQPRTTAADWAESGAMHLTGTPEGPPRLVEGAPATTMRGALIALAALARTAGLDPTRLPDHRALSERAAVMGLQRAGRRSAGGATRLLDTADKTLALTLSRDADFAALPALLEVDEIAGDPWTSIASMCRRGCAADLVERAALLGLAAGVVEQHPAEPNVIGLSEGCLRPKTLGSAGLLVVDLSALWAGPLCGHLLGCLGARVVVVESSTRPDPTRHVAPDFHRLLRGDAERVVLDVHTPEGVAKLADLVTQADVVIESTRPRALLQLGVYPAEIVAAAKACTWVSITAYGRAHNRVGYGDDVAAAAGLLGTGVGFGAPVFAGDAIADPLTGAHAAVAALAGVLTGRSAVLDLAMHDVARAARTPLPQVEVVNRDGRWHVDDGRTLTAVREPMTRPVP